MSDVRDLLVVVPDKHIEQTVLGLLGRHHALAIREITFDVIVHVGRDPGCYMNAHALAEHFKHTHRHALVLFDLAWEGAPSTDPTDLEAKVRGDLGADWGARGDCVVIDPEIEIWVWSDSPHVDAELGWKDRTPPLRKWLEARGLLDPGSAKPADPKRAFEEAIRRARLQASSAIFGALARKVSVARCTDPSFSRPRSVLARWFPPS